jgi:hypothetical protein
MVVCILWRGASRILAGNFREPMPAHTQKKQFCVVLVRHTFYKKAHAKNRTRRWMADYVSAMIHRRLTRIRKGLHEP